MSLNDVIDDFRISATKYGFKEINSTHNLHFKNDIGINVEFNINSLCYDFSYISNTLIKSMTHPIHSLGAFESHLNAFLDNLKNRKIMCQDHSKNIT